MKKIRISSLAAVALFFTLLTGLVLPVSLSWAISSSDFSTKSLAELNQKRKHDFDGMKKRRIIKILMPFSKTFYFFDGADQKGLGYETAKLFETYINKKYQTENLKIQVIIIPSSRESLLNDLTSGVGDIAVANLTVTDKRQKIVDFANPILTGVSEVLVTNKSRTVKNLFDLSGREIHVRKSSSYYESLLALNKVLQETGKKTVKIVPAEELLEDEDLLEMVNANLIPAIIMDNHKADFWGQIFDNIKVHDDIQLAIGGDIAWAIRKNSPLLKKEINDFVKTHKKGTLKGNVLFNRYLKDTKYITNSMSSEHRKRFEHLVVLFEKYGQEYDFDYLMLTALAYQESKLDQSRRSRAGAIGVMQILPSTAKDKNVNIHGIEKVDPNIHAGTKYLRFMADQYFSDDPNLDNLNKALFAFASYNAGPNRIAKLRKEAAKSGLDPNQWFNNVEIIAAKRIGRETVQYVSNIFKYYVAYKLINERNTKIKRLQK